MPVRLAALGAALVLVACGTHGGPAQEPAPSEPRRPSSEVGEEPRGPLTFAVLGDFGTGSPAQFAVADRMCRWRRKHPFDLVLTTGDNIYDRGNPYYFPSRFYEPYRCLLHHGVRFRSTLGNHDVLTGNGRPELREDAFGFNGRNYVIRRAGVRFVFADSTELNREWLRRAVMSDPGDRWKVVVFHHPVFSPGFHGGEEGFRPSLPRLFRRRGVDLVLNGHDHLYAVTREIRQIRYVVTGGGGAELYSCRDRWFTDRCVERHHFLYVVAGRDYLRVRAVPPSGRPFDRFRTDGRP